MARKVSEEKVRLAKQGLKKCPKCEGVFEYMYFSKTKSCSDGHYAHCKACHSGNAAFEKVRLFSEGKKRCGGCGEVKLLDKFGMRSGNGTGVSARCKACNNTLSKRNYRPERRKLQSVTERAQERLWSDEYRKSQNEKKRLKRQEREAKDPARYKELRREKRKRWAERNPLGNAIKSSNRRALLNERGGKISKELIVARFDYHGNKCVYCGCGGKLTIDHQIPISRGGLNIASNVVPSCKSCNSSKGGKTPSEFAKHKVISTKF